MLIRTGHLSQFTYLLFSGSVFVNIEENDLENGKKYYRTAAVLGKGTVFGVGFIYQYFTYTYAQTQSTVIQVCTLYHYSEVQFISHEYE